MTNGSLGEGEGSREGEEGSSIFEVRFIGHDNLAISALVQPDQQRRTEIVSLETALSTVFTMLAALKTEMVGYGYARGTNDVLDVLRSRDIAMRSDAWEARREAESRKILDECLHHSEAS